MKRWSDEDVERFAQLRAEVGLREAARRMRMTPGQAGGLAYRLDHDLRRPWVREGIYKSVITALVDEGMHDAMRARAKADGCSIAAKLREYIEWGLENDAQT